MERGHEASRDADEIREEAVRAAVDALRDLRGAGVSTAIEREAEALASALDAEASSDPARRSARKPRRFGAFAGKFRIGPEFFEPLSEEERRAWGEA
ncbi:hypothetical protein [Methylobacterium nigriterrae]|uniref:hypothetical protein n=1 Tax=Methylobacterium nigriterrae TaxID=3127512 RepID=UPI00301399E8